MIKRRRLQRRHLFASLNEYGNIDLRNAMPRHLVHISGKITDNVEDLPIPFVSALDGFESVNGKWRPTFDGIVVAELDESRVLLEIDSPSANRRRLKKDFEIDVSKEVPNGLTHIPGKRLQPLARKTGVNFCDAIVGWEYDYRELRRKVKNGIVVSSLDAPAIRKSIEARKARNTPEVRERRKRTAEKREKKRELEFAKAIRSRFPSMPEGEEFLIASHTMEVGSGRVGRSKTAPDPVAMAVAAHVRWNHTNYENILEDCHEHYRKDKSYRRFAAEMGLSPALEAKEVVGREVKNILSEWSQTSLD